VALFVTAHSSRCAIGGLFSFLAGGGDMVLWSRHMNGGGGKRGLSIDGLTTIITNYVQWRDRQLIE